MADKHEHILKGAGFIHTTTYGGKTPAYSHQAHGMTNGTHVRAAHKYLQSHGYKITHTQTARDTKPSFGAKHDRATHHYSHADGRKATVTVTHRLVGNTPTHQWTGVHADHLDK